MVKRGVLRRINWSTLKVRSAGKVGGARGANEQADFRTAQVSRGCAGLGVGAKLRFAPAAQAQPFYGDGVPGLVSIRIASSGDGAREGSHHRPAAQCVSPHEAAGLGRVSSRNDAKCRHALFLGMD